MSDHFADRKSLSAQFSVDAPPPFEHTDPETLAALLRQTDAVTVVDVRLPEEYASGHILGSINVPHSDFSPAQLLKLVQGKRSVNPKHRLVFTSLQSPDVDEAVAQDFVRTWEDSEPDKALAADTSFVSLLLGGVYYWLRLFRHDSSLTSSFSSATWRDVFEDECI